MKTATTTTLTDRCPQNVNRSTCLAVICLVVVLCPIQVIILIRFNNQITQLQRNVTWLNQRLQTTVVGNKEALVNKRSVEYEFKGLDQVPHRSADDAIDELLSPASDFVILPTYARVPLETLQKFCQTTTLQCKDVNERGHATQYLRGPPGPPGPPGKDCDCTNSNTSARDIAEPQIGAFENMQLSNTTHTTVLNETSKKSWKYGNVHHKHRKHKHRPTRKRPNPKKRLAKCYIHSLGNIVNYGERTSFFGAWMRDPLDMTNERYWVMEHIFGISVSMFNSREQLEEKLTKEMVDLEDMYEGTNHVVYNSSLYYHRMGKNTIVKHDLLSGNAHEFELHDVVSRGSEYLYQQQGEIKSYIDLATDEHGLWVIYRRHNRHYLSISRLGQDLSEDATWEVEDLGPSNISNAFIVCGVLYTVTVDGETGTAHVSKAYDLYTHQVSDVYPELQWTGVHGNISMLNYNPGDHNLYVYDQGYIYTVPVNIVNAHK